MLSVVVAPAFYIAPLKTAEALDQLPSDTMVVSDPHTLSVIRARSGSMLHSRNPILLRSTSLRSRASEELCWHKLRQRADFCAALREMLPIAGDYRHMLDRRYLRE